MNYIDVSTLSRSVGADDQVPLFRQYFRVAVRWRYVLAGALAASLLIGLIITLLMTPQYSATTTLEIAREGDRVVNIQEVEQEGSLADQEFYQTQYGLLRSRILAEGVVVRLKLDEDRAFFDLFGEDFDDARLASKEERRRVATEILLDNIDVAPTRLSRLVDLSFTSPDADLSTRIVNEWAENFIRSNLERRFEANAYARRFLEGRLEALRKRLEELERQLVGYASTQRIINLPASGQGENRGTERSIVADDLAAFTRNCPLLLRTEFRPRLGLKRPGVPRVRFRSR